MRILLVGPTGGGGSIPPYLHVLTNALRFHGARVDRIGSTGVPYDRHTSRFWPAERILRAAENLLEVVDLASYDVISVHFGNLEVEQLIPTLWKSDRPAVYHVHSLDWTLFTAHVPDASLRAAVDTSIAHMDGLVFFGAYGKSRFDGRFGLHVPTTVSWLPTTIPSGARPAAGPRLCSALRGDHGPIGSLYGYAAPWKDPAGLIAACRKTRTPCNVIVAGPSWDDPHQAGADLSQEANGGAQHGAVHVEAVAEYLEPCQRKALALGSRFAVFPYVQQSTFQGSGAIADYLAHGVPVLGTDVANMAELVADAGLITVPGDHDAFAEGIDNLAGNMQHRNRLARNARRRSRQFSATKHAAQCLRLYETAIDHRRNPKR